MRTVSTVSGRNAFADEDGKGRDRALAFTWRAERLNWLKDLGLPRTGSRKRDEAREAILLEAVMAEAGGPTAVSYSRRRAFYADQQRYYGIAFTYDTVVPTIDDLVRRGLLTTWIAPGKGPCGRQSTFRATPLLLEAVPDNLLENVKYVVHELIRLKDSKKRLIAYQDTTHTNRMRRLLADQNEAISAARIDVEHPEVIAIGGLLRMGDTVLYPAMKQLYRVFNGSWHLGGRSYGGWWQQVSKAVRGHLCIDGEPVVEEDHSQLHPRLLYKRAGRILHGDAYSLSGCDRRLGKVAFNILLNATTYEAAVGAIANRIDAPYAKLRAQRLIEEIKARHAEVRDFFHSGIGLELQNVDAAMAEAVATRLLKKGIVSLPIHDSHIVQERHRGELLEAMQAAFSNIRR